MAELKFTAICRLNNRVLSTQCMSRRFLFLCLLLIKMCFVFYAIHWLVSKRDITTLKLEINKINDAFLVDTSTCRIPNIDPFDSAVKHYFSVSKWKPCPGNSSLTYQDGNILRLNQTVIRRLHGNNFNVCRAYPIVRNNINDRSYKYGKVAIEFKDDVEVRYEFIKVQCYNRKSAVIYINFHAFIHQKVFPTKNAVTAKYNKTVLSSDHSKKINQSKTILFAEPTIPNPTVPVVKNPINIMLVGVDSVSRLNFMRQMSQTRKYMLEHGAIEMAGYNKVGDNTRVNMGPLLAGKYLEDLPWSEKLKNKPFDKYTFIWKKYKQYGFVIMLAEDAPRMSIFKYGFPPVPIPDHYYRDLALAMEDERSVWSADHNCIRDRMENEMVLQYTYDFVRAYQQIPHFSLSFITRLTHNDVNKAGRGDKVYLKFFKKLFDQQLLNNTLLFFFSDHGIRFGSFRKTYVGRLEERLPFMFIIPPPWLKSRFPHIWDNLNINSHRLTTPFDIYKTLIGALDIDKASLQLSKMGGDPKERKLISLFSRVPYNRTCDQATILPHWCTCHQATHININDSFVINIAQYLVKSINDWTAKLNGSCARLRLGNIVDAAVFKANGQVLSFRDCINRHVKYGNAIEQINTDYQLTIETLPGAGRFEATLRYHTKTKRFKLVGDISRTNKYGYQSDCISDSNFKKFCYCFT